jgi:hypothetical protein
MNPTWTPREIDIVEHLTWVNAARDGWLIPNYHLPAATSPGLFCPLMALLAQVTKLGMDASAAYASAEVLAGIFGAYCILTCLRLFLTSRRQVVMAVLLMLAAVPLISPLTVWRALRGIEGGPPVFIMADGLFVTGPVTLVLGTASVYASLILVTRYLLLGRRRYLYLTAVVATISGLCHPFEVFTIMAATSATLIVVRWPSLRSALAEIIMVIVPGVLSILPYIYFSLTVPWVRELTAQNVYRLPDLFHLLSLLGVPVAFVLLNLAVGPKLRATTDMVLQCWFVATLVVMHIPRLPWVVHAADGLASVAALLAVRQISQIPYLHRWAVRWSRWTMIAVVATAVPAIFVHAGIRYMMFRDGVKLESAYGMSAVSSQAEYDLIQWFRRNGSSRDLVIAPNKETSWMLTTAPVHSIASHWLFSGKYEEQARLRYSFYHGDWSDDAARDYLRKYGINYVVVPEGSLVHRVLNEYPKVALFPPWTLYYLPENHLPDSLPKP